MRLLAPALLLFAVTAAAAAPKTVAPATMPHPIAMFLSDLSAKGKQRVTFKAAAVGTHFFFEEAAGVTVYVYDGAGYRKEAFLKSATIASALKRYGAKP
jgi:ABC-type transport system involved in cytochrome bd biosynthesis fused ATPase/permease subunit